MSGLSEFIHQNFGLPDGGLYSNLIASALLAVLALRKYIKHERTKELGAQMRHNELKAHISSEHQASRLHAEQLAKGIN